MAVKRYDGSAWQTVAGLGAQGAAATSSSIATWVKTASGGETSLSGNDDNSQALSYTVGQELVFINGTLLKRGSDYTATNGTSITGLTALAANDVATVWTVNAFSVANTYTQAQVDAGFAANSTYFAAGKNKIINGDFAINQRAFSSTSTLNTYMFDRWIAGVNGTATFSAQTFTPGSAPVSGYEGTNFIRVAGTTQSSAGNYIALSQRIEDVRTLAGQTVTVSFWAKASSGTPSVAIDLYQEWVNGSGHTNSANIPITTSWARYSATLTLPTMAGKTIGANSYLQLWLFTSVGSTISGYGYPALGLQTATIDFWGVQVEAGSVATAFQTATGTLQGELAACQRYYQRFTGKNSAAWSGYVPAAASTYFFFKDFYCPMRIQPTVTITTSSNSTQMGAPTVGATSDWGADAVRFNSVSTGTAENRAFFMLESYDASAEL